MTSILSTTAFLVLLLFLVRYYLSLQCPRPGKSTKDVHGDYEVFVTRHTLIKKFAMPITGKPLQVFPNIVYSHIASSDVDGKQVLYLLSGKHDACT